MTNRQRKVYWSYLVSCLLLFWISATFFNKSVAFAKPAFLWQELTPTAESTSVQYLPLISNPMLPTPTPTPVPPTPTPVPPTPTP
ncbi:MAG: hypothetical protein KDE31_30030, partial [Caldilineaceae bacterium]|nr:hypothetical protein [Caldilineaceae bacterium]